MESNNQRKSYKNSNECLHVKHHSPGFCCFSCLSEWKIASTETFHHRNEQLRTIRRFYSKEYVSGRKRRDDSSSIIMRHKPLLSAFHMKSLLENGKVHTELKQHADNDKTDKQMNGVIHDKRESGELIGTPPFLCDELSAHSRGDVDNSTEWNDSVWWAFLWLW